MADLTGDQIARLREVASTEGPGHMYAAWRQLNAVLDENDRLNAELIATRAQRDDGIQQLKTENDRLRQERPSPALINEVKQLDADNYILRRQLEALREENTALGVRWAEQYDRAEKATQALAAWIETVRDVAESLGETGSASDSLAAQTLNTACDQAQGES